MFKKLTPEQRVEECRKKMIVLLAKYKCVLDASVTISAGKVEPKINVVALKR